jgi:hypothetical protein
MIESELRTYLLAQSGIAALIGTRVYPMKLPQSPTLPAITYQRVSGSRVQSLTGPSGMAHPRIQVDCWAASYDGAKALAAEVQDDLDGYRGTMGTTRVGGVIVYGDRDWYEPDVDIYRVTIDITIWHDE